MLILNNSDKLANLIDESYVYNYEFYNKIAHKKVRIIYTPLVYSFNIYVLGMILTNFW